MRTTLKAAGNRSDAAHAGRAAWSLAAWCAAGLLLAPAAAALAQQAETAPSAPPAVRAPGGEPAPRNTAGSHPPGQSDWDLQSALLLKLATELKQEVDQTTENVLSVQVVKTAGAIERLSRVTQQKIKSLEAAN